MTYPQQLTDRVSLLGNTCFSIYLVQGKHTQTLIEPGISAIAGVVPDQINDLGVAPNTVRDLVLPHAHADHVTGAPILKALLPELRVKASIKTRDLLKKPKIQDLFLKDDADIQKNLKMPGAPQNPRNETLSLADLVDETLTPGEVLDVDGYPLQILDAPGHCIGGIALWQPDDKILFCSDYLGFRLPSGTFVTNFYVDYNAYLETFNRLSRLAPEWICPGHCGAFSGEKALRYMEGSLAEIKWVYELVTANAGSPSKLEQIKETLFQKYYVDEATMFSETSTRYCVDLLVRRVLDSTPKT